LLKILLFDRRLAKASPPSDRHSVFIEVIIDFILSGAWKITSEKGEDLCSQGFWAI